MCLAGLGAVEDRGQLHLYSMICSPFKGYVFRVLGFRVSGFRV